MADSKITVGIADMKIAKGDGILITYALGSCIGLCFHDPVFHLAALLHVMLPLNMRIQGSARPCGSWRCRGPDGTGSQ